MIRLFASLSLVLAAAALAGCNDGGTGPVASAPIAPSAYHVAGGAPCSGEIDTYQAVVAHDLETGNVEQKVADQIHDELARAAAACTAGQNAKAHAIVASSKAKHGYRA
jgi:hypothetical protein